MTKTYKLLRRFIYNNLPNKIRYLILYYINKRRIPNLLRPRDYSEYICRDMLFNRNDSKAFLADKYNVREYVEGKGLGSILTNLYGVWDNATKIDFNSLPDKFVLKCTHSCGMNILCEDKSKLENTKAIVTLNKWLNTSHPVFYESHYKKIKPLIICEEYIFNNSGSLPLDFKIHCAHGKPILIQVCYDRNNNNSGKRILYDTNWKNMHYVINDDSHFSNNDISKPMHLEEMLHIASILSTGLEYVRIDLYETDNKVIFGEITLTPMGGWLSYFTQEALTAMGDKIRRR
jgi:hypothetical protein